MEEFYLRLLLALQKLDIVDNQAVDIAVFLTEGFRGFVLNRVDDFVGEFSLEVYSTFMLGLFCLMRLPIACIRCVFPRPTPP